MGTLATPPGNTSKFVNKPNGGVSADHSPQLPPPPAKDAGSAASGDSKRANKSLADQRAKARTSAKRQQAAERIAASTEQLASGVTESKGAADQLALAMEQIASGATQASSGAEQSQQAAVEISRAAKVMPRRLPSRSEKPRYCKHWCGRLPKTSLRLPIP